MSGRDFLQKLLDGERVEWKALGSLGELVRGNGLQKKDFTESGVPAIHYGQIYTHYGLSTTETKSFVSPDLAKNLKKVDKGDVVITNTSENVEDVGKALVYLGERQAVTGGHATILKPGKCLLGKYFAHFTQTEEFAGEKRKYAKGTKVIDVSAADMAKIQIPIPCPDKPKKSLAIQAEIVRILDAFTELTAELTARKKQYNHYRDQLLRFEEGTTKGTKSTKRMKVEWKTLGEVAYFYNAKAHEKLVSHDGDVALLTARFISSEGRSVRFVKRADVLTPALKNDVAMVMSDLPNGRALAKTFFVSESGLYAANQRVCLLRVKEPTILAPKFLHYVMNRNRQLLAYDNGVDQTHLKKDWILNVRIPVPPLAEQERIVAILDKFDALTNSLTEGLPREIELRQKQYEYYRDLLFNFPKTQEGGG